MHHQIGPSQEHNDAVERVLRQAEMSRLTRNLKSKLALASMQAQHSSSASQTPPPSAGGGMRKRAKTLEGASSAPRFLTASEPARRPSQQKRHSLPSGGSAGSPHRGSLSYKSNPGSRHSPRPLSRSSSITAIPPMPPLPTVFVGNNAFLSDEGDRLAHNTTDLRSSHSSTQTASHNSSPIENEAEGAAAAAAAVAAGGLPEDESHLEPPQTPPQRRRMLKPSREAPSTPERSRGSEDGASLLLHFAHSPGHAVTPRTPDFNMSDYLHFQTPSPARPALGTPRRMNHWGSLSSFSSLSSNIFVPSSSGVTDSATPTPVKSSNLLSPAQRPPMPGIPIGSRVRLEKSPSDL